MKMTTAAKIRRSAQRGNRGFSLLEVMIVIGVLGFGLLGLTSMQLHAMRGGVRGRHATDAAAIADAQMEQLQQIRWDSPLVEDTGGWTTNVTMNTTVQRESATTVEQPYTMVYRVTDIVAGATRSVDVRVNWVDDTGRNRFIALSSIRFNRESL